MSIVLRSKPTTTTWLSLGAAGNSASVARRWNPANTSAERPMAASPVTAAVSATIERIRRISNRCFVAHLREERPRHGVRRTSRRRGLPLKHRARAIMVGMHPLLALAVSTTVLIVVGLLSVVVLVLIIVAPWRQVREEPPLDKAVEAKLLLHRNPDEPTGEVPASAASPSRTPTTTSPATTASSRTSGDPDEPDAPRG